MRPFGLAATILLAAWPALAAGCSQPQPTSPALQDVRVTSSSTGHVLLGMYQVQIDLASETAHIQPLRAGGKHFDVTEFLFPPYCNDCFSIEVVEFDWDNFEVTANVTVKNFTRALTGYDVRGIIYPLGDYLLKNPHAYTLLHAPPGVIDPCGFRAFDTTDPDRAMGPAESATETFVIGFPPGAGFIDLVYAIDASWPDHCPEPYDIYGFEQSPLGIDPGSTAQVTVYVSDWQDDTSAVGIDTDVLGGSETPLSHYSGDIWIGAIENTLGLPTGSYPCLIAGTDVPTLNNLYQWIEVEVVDSSDHDPPTWDDEIGIISVAPGLTGILVEFGTASDPNGPVTYNLYWVEGGTLDFDTANKVAGIETSPYLLTDLNLGLHTLCLRAEDAVGNETANVDFESATVGEHPNVWWTSGPNMPTPRGYAGGFIAEGCFWALGGSATAATLDTVERYDITRETWDSPWSLPEPRDAFGCGTLDGMGYIFAGRFSETEVTDTCHVVDLADGSFVISPPTFPMPLATMGCALLDGTFYLAGGRHFTGSTWVFHREAFSFTPPGPGFVGETDLEFETSTMGFAAGDGYLMSCGGHPDRQDVLYHIPGTKSWQFRAPLDPGRDGNVSVWVDGWLYSMGGGVGWITIPSVDVLDVEGDVWFSINPMNGCRAVATAATDGTYIYIAGGLRAAGPALIPLASFEIGRIY